jgi:hypothetical protein
VAQCFFVPAIAEEEDAEQKIAGGSAVRGESGAQQGFQRGEIR